MATIHLGRQLGDVGFSRVVAIKRLHPQYCTDPDFTLMFIDEARLAARIQHPNVVSTLDVVATDDEVLLVLDYVHGESLWRLLRFGSSERPQVPLGIASSIVCDVLHGLHAAHGARDRYGNPLRIVHRDVSPQNVLVGVDGVARVLDFGIAKAADSIHLTEAGTVRGKAAYMAPEQLAEGKVTSRADLYGAGVMLWELLSQERLFGKGMKAALVKQLRGKIEPPSSRNPDVSPELDAVVMRALAWKPADRFDSGNEMAAALDTACPSATREEVIEWVEHRAGAELAKRSALVGRVERGGGSMRPPGAATGERRGSRLEERQMSGLVEVDVANHDHFDGAATSKYKAPDEAALRQASHPTVGARGRLRRRTWLVSLGVVSTLALGAVMLFGAGPEATSPSSLRTSSGASPDGEAAPSSTQLGVANDAQDIGSAPARPKPAPRTAAAPPPNESANVAIPTAKDPSTGEPDRDPANVDTSNDDAKPPTAVKAPRAKAKVPKPAARRRRARKATKSKAKCSPPYTIDASGRRHFKKECF